MKKDEFESWAKKHDWVYVTTYEIDSRWENTIWLSPTGRVVHVQFKEDVLYGVN